MKEKEINPRPTTNRENELSRFPHKETELKWSERWYQDKLYRADDSSPKPKYYVLDMYPYPSGAGLHVGHVEGYTASDIVARFKRMNGFEVLHPMGWDAFGLPTENYAIETGRNPHDVTAENIATFKAQCQRSGFSIDWDREIDTSKEDYYKWTQRLFVELFKEGLAYKDEAPANWCPDCVTVIANEQVVGGCCERCSAQVETKRIEQWFFKITDYADRLIEDLDQLDWPESTKIGQINWIGRSEGRNIRFSIIDGDLDDLTVFTTRPETLYGASFIAIAPEHPLVEKLVSDDQRELVNEYASRVIPQTQIERKKTNREKTGVFTGKYVQNPLTGKKLPVWVADYVLMDYGTGTIMGVPAHDERDKDFAEGHDLEIIPVVKPNEEHPDDTGKSVFVAGKHKGQRVEDAIEQLFRDLGDRSEQAVQYKLRDWLISRERYWGAPIPIIHCDQCGDQPVPVDQLPVLLPKDIEDYKPTGIPPLAKSEQFMETSCPHCNGVAKREAKTLDTFVDSSWYFLRFADPHNPNDFASEDLLKRWLPVDFYVGGTEHTVGHLLYARFITKALYDMGYLKFDEPFISLRHPGIVLGPDQRKMSKRWGNVIKPEDVADEFGSDTLRLYEMFMGPLDKSKPWNTRSVTGVRKFIDRVWRLQEKVEESVSETERQLTNTLIANITTAVETGRYNIAVSEFMKYVNGIEEIGNISRDSLEKFLKCFAPFAPFITEEMWMQLKDQYSIHLEQWPKPILTMSEHVTPKVIPIQINGKIRGVVEISSDFTGTEEELRQLIESESKILEKVSGKPVQRIVYIPGKIINIVT